MRRAVVFSMALSLLALTACHKRKRLTQDDFDFHVSPPASTVVKGSTVTLTAQSASADVNPTWSISGVGTLSSNLGRQVDFSSDQLGDSTVTAIFDGVATTAQIAVVSYAPSPNVLEVYSDSLFPSMPNLVGPNPIFDGSTFGLGSSAESSTGYTPQGTKYFHVQITSTAPGTNMYWGIVITGNPTSVDVSAYNSLAFDLRINHAGGLGNVPANVLVEIQDKNAVKKGVTLDATHGLNRLSEDWQEIRISRTEFSAQGVDTTLLTDPFIITLQSFPGPASFDLDAIRWEK